MSFDPVLNAPIYYWAPLIASFIFWLVDEILRRKMKTKIIVPVHYQM
ncbi:hypothetical protein [Filobacillus milosensis]|nr:hypothetical protein [Filobacillus milosensis]